MPVVALITLTGVLFYALFHSGGALKQDWYPCLLVIAAVGIVYWLARKSNELTPALKHAARFVLLMIPMGAVLQLIPLPTYLVHLLSPARTSLQAHLPNAPAWVTLSATPSATVTWFLTLLACVVIFVLIHDIAWCLEGRVWFAVFPLIAIALIEAILGLLQTYWSERVPAALGTYADRNHFAALLQMSLPFSLMCGIAVLRYEPHKYSSPLRPALAACLCLTCAAVSLVAVGFSMEPFSLAICLASSLVMAALGLGARFSRKRWIPILVLALLLGSALVAFARHEPADDLGSGGLGAPVSMFRDYPLLGCGLGSYASCAPQYQPTEPASTSTPNDYLRALAELGLLGMAPFAALALLTLEAMGTAALREPGNPANALAIACAGSFTATALHSLIASNLYLPAHAIAAAWIAALAHVARDRVSDRSWE